MCSFLDLLAHFISHSLQFTRARLENDSKEELLRWSTPLTVVGKYVARKLSPFSTGIDVLYVLPSITTDCRMFRVCFAFLLYIQLLSPPEFSIRRDPSVALLHHLWEGKVGPLSSFRLCHYECS